MSRHFPFFKMNLLIKNAKILSMESPEIYESDLLIEGEYIEKIEKNIEKNSDRIIDAKGKLLMPAFVNCHTHVGMSLFRNYGGEVSLYSWLKDYIWPLEEKLNDEDVYTASLMSFTEMVKNGIGSFADMYFFSEATIKAALEVGIRGEISRGLAIPDPCDFKIKENLSLHRKYKDSDLINIGFGPHAVYTTDIDYLEKISNLAKENNLPIHIHLLETKKENEDCFRRFKMTPTEVFKKAGIFENRTIAAHGVHLTDKDLDILKENKVSIVHNPASNLKLKSGFLNLAKVLDKGINIALGTDSSASNNKLSILREMELTGLVSKLYSSRDIEAYEILKMATINGARALGMDDKIGSVKEGKLADLILIDLDNINHKPENNILSSLIYSTYEDDIKYTIVNGNVIYENNRVVGIDNDLLDKKIKEASDRLGL